VPVERYVENVLAMVELARAAGAGVLVVGPVYRDLRTNPPEGKRLRFYRASLREAMQSRGVPYLEIEELTEAGYPANEPLFGELVHPSSMGHELMAQRILAALDREGLIDAPPSDPSRSSARVRLSPSAGCG
jgi:lysophospholipase L1-like esterase